MVQTHLVVYEDEHDVRLLPLVQGLVLVWFRSVGTQAVQAAENTQHSQSSGGSLHRYYRSPEGNKKEKHYNTAGTSVTARAVNLKNV